MIKRNRSFQVLARYIPVVMSHQLLLWPREYIYTWLMESVVKRIGSGTVVHFENRGWHGFLKEERGTHVHYIVVLFQLTITLIYWHTCTCIHIYYVLVFSFIVLVIQKTIIKTIRWLHELEKKWIDSKISCRNFNLWM